MTKPTKPSKRTSLPQSLRFDILRRDNFTCRYCGRSSPDVVLHVDHVTAVANGGTDDPANLITSCSDCNFGKRTKVVEGVEPIQPANSLVGLYGLEFEGSYQFKIVRKLSDESYLVQLYDWLLGDPTNTEVRATSTLLNPVKCKLFLLHSVWLEQGDLLINKELRAV